MVQFDVDGAVTFQIHRPKARSVVLVGAFDGWHQQRLPMWRDAAGLWRVTLKLGAGEYLFRYLIDDREWAIDEDAHGVVRTAPGRLMSRCWRPPASLDPDALAA